MAMNRVASARLLTLAAFAALAGCSGGGGGTTTGALQTTGKFLVLKTDPVNSGRIYLNDPIKIDFSTKVDLDSANLSNVSFQPLDQLGNPVSEMVSGAFQISTSPGDLEPGRRLLFVPRLPTNNSYDNGGFRSGRTYLVRLVGGSAYNGTALRDVSGKALSVPTSFSFTTTEGTLPSQLFRNPIAGGPRRKPVDGLTVSTATNLSSVPLNHFGAPPVEIRLAFDQALNPNDANIPVSLDTNPLVRSINNRGNIFLEYDDADLDPLNPTWIPADVELEQNDINGCVLVLRPVGVLPNNATVRVIVENTVEDVSGESNAGNLSYNRIFGSFTTQRAYDQQFNAIVESFDVDTSIDYKAAFPEPIADVGPGYVKAGFSFEGRSTSLEYEPTAREVVLNTSFTQIVPKNGLPFNVSGGVFNFKNVTIPQGVSVKGQGPNPMVWLVSGDFRVAGELSVKGGNGSMVTTLNSANFAKAGGVGVCGGGNGGDGTPSGNRRDLFGATGNGPLQVPGKGGGGGRLACTAGCWTGSGYADSGGGSGGGGGTLATQGDPRYDTGSYTGSQFQERLGIGGAGCSGSYNSRTAVLAGGTAGPRVFIDTRADNNFWGTGINLATNIRITGEISVPMGGGGGGGGGDTSYNTSCSTTDAGFANDYSGGGGGGGGGALIVKALGEIEILPTGKIIADGGGGGGGEQVGSCGEAGGGGGGAGGMVVLMSATRIILHAHGTTSGATTRYLFRGPAAIDKDYNFSISADGGVTTTGSFTAPVVTSKYPAVGGALLSASVYDENPLGGFGGMGIVQLMVPPGDNSDGTNTALDDNITVVLPTNPPVGLTKQSVLGWRGHPNETGTVYTNDNGVAFTAEEGDIRPAPTLLPVPFNAKSRIRSKWIDTGSSKRRPIAADDGLPRGIVLGGTASVGPVYEFAGLDNSSTTPGYVDYEPVGQTGVKIVYPTAVPAMDVVSSNASASYEGALAYELQLTTGALAAYSADRYVQFEAELLNTTGSVVGSFRILHHTADTIVLAPEAVALPADVARVRIMSKFFKIITNGAEGLGPVHLPVGSAVPIPQANVRIGFAFHRDPSSGAAGRYPLDPKTFVYDMNDVGLQNWIQTNGAPRYIQWDVTFNSTFSVTPSLSPESPLPELHFLRIPFRF